MFNKKPKPEVPLGSLRLVFVINDYGREVYQIQKYVEDTEVVPKQTKTRSIRAIVWPEYEDKVIGYKWEHTINRQGFRTNYEDLDEARKEYSALVDMAKQEVLAKRKQKEHGTKKVLYSWNYG